MDVHELSLGSELAEIFLAVPRRRYLTLHIIGRWPHVGRREE